MVACRGQYFVKSAGCFGSIAPARLLFLWSGALAAAYGVFGLLLMADSGLWARKSYFAFVMADHGALGLYVVSRRFPLIPGVSCCFSGEDSPDDSDSFPFPLNGLDELAGSSARSDRSGRE